MIRLLHQTVTDIRGLSLIIRSFSFVGKLEIRRAKNTSISCSSSNRSVLINHPIYTCHPSTLIFQIDNSTRLIYRLSIHISAPSARITLCGNSIWYTYFVLCVVKFFWISFQRINYDTRRRWLNFDEYCSVREISSVKFRSINFNKVNIFYGCLTWS